MMNRYILSLLILLCGGISTLHAQGETTVPRLSRQGTATQLIVDDKPFLMLGGELGNSTASSLADLDRAFPKLQQMGLNTVLVPAYWELIEPTEGTFDFTLVDGAIERARQHDLKVIFLWFGVWKNSMSCYAPMWVKENVKKYPRAETKSGRKLEILSAYSATNLKADQRAFSQFMKHLSEIDKKDRTVIMVQVENEIGMIEDARDYSKEANSLFKADVPQQLTDYLQKNKKSLHPVLLKRWEVNGCKTHGNWETLFGQGLETDELFMAWSYARFVQELAQAGKDTYPLPMYLNAALNSRGRQPGQYPAAGPLAHLMDIWHCAAPAIDLLAPDIYDPGFTDWCRQYAIKGNPLFIPEIRLGEANAAQVFYAFGQHDAMGFSPFSIESPAQPEQYPLTKSYHLLRQLLPLLAEKQGKGFTNGVWVDGTTQEQIVERNNYRFTCRHDYTLGWSPEAKSANPWPESGALIIELAPKEYIVAGTGVVITFDSEKGKNIGIGAIDEVELRDGKMIPLRRLNGDQDHQGRHLRIPVGEWSIQHVKLYEY